MWIAKQLPLFVTNSTFLWEIVVPFDELSSIIELGLEEIQGPSSKRIIHSYVKLVIDIIKTKS